MEANVGVMVGWSDGGMTVGAIDGMMVGARDGLVVDGGSDGLVVGYTEGMRKVAGDVGIDVLKMGPLVIGASRGRYFDGTTVGVRVSASPVPSSSPSCEERCASKATIAPIPIAATTANKAPTITENLVLFHTGISSCSCTLDSSLPSLPLLLSLSFSLRPLLLSSGEFEPMVERGTDRKREREEDRKR